MHTPQADRPEQTKAGESLAHASRQRVLPTSLLIQPGPVQDDPDARISSRTYNWTGESRGVDCRRSAGSGNTG